MRVSSNGMWSTGRSSTGLEADLPVPIEIKAVANARRLRLRFDEASRTLKLTCPPRSSRRSALAWAVSQREWIDQQIARAAPPRPFVPGAVIAVEGQSVALEWARDASRTAQLVDGKLICGGPERGFARRVENYLRRLALDRMSAEVAHYCAAAGVPARSVTIGDAATRWGSCTSDGRIRLSWRLILTPPAVRRYVVAHEVAHLVHLNHGPQFKALEAQLYGPGLAEAKTWLRREGSRLRGVGRRG